MGEDEDLLLAVLNSAPVADGVRAELLGAVDGGVGLEGFGGLGTESELRALRRARDALQRAIRGDSEALDGLAEALRSAVLRPEVRRDGVRWHLDVPAEERLAARSVLAWSRVEESMPGRLRACANSECNLFLIDRSRPGTAKWCSMATCGNRMKARTHARRARQA
ncbi:CGNR zinc finger protein [Bogoriella caseilytica]|uniref:CGNR zinc finger protein n=1 Tax=Bogoriella caseilytica TaxID=56055 RepID=A0A3N2B9E0_9MICO|nr:CGNR zinc finger protein [Bogoriella caseilytica]